MTNTKLSIALKNVIVSDGTVVDVPLGGLLVVVGPNNVGKTTFLTDINNMMQYSVNEPSIKLTVVKNGTVIKEGEKDGLINWLDDHAEKAKRPREGYVRLNQQQPLSGEAAWSLWQQDRLDMLWPLLSLYADASSRLSGTAAGMYDIQVDAPSNPLHHLYSDEELENRLSDIAQEVFETPLFLPRQGTTLRLYLGSPRASLTSKGVPSRDYLEEVTSLPLLDEQGHGMKSFMHLALNLLVQNNFFILVDEPEAFLHPPQARALGELLSKETKKNTQVIVSTHSSDIIKGILSAPEVPVSIVRLTRTNNVNHAKQLSHESIKSLWRDPALRHSNLLDGLFHHAVVLCEGDADCKYYSAVLETLPKNRQRYSNQDLLFTSSGGKHRLAIMAQALMAVNVPVRIAVDVDILDDEDNAKKLIESLGGDWSKVSKDFTIVKTNVEALAANGLSWAFIKEQLQNISLTIEDTETVTAAKVKVTDLFKKKTGWEMIKKAGIAGFPQGDAKKAFDRLNRYFQSVGLHIVPVGELERFVPEVGNHGPKWVNEVLENGLHENKGNTNAINFVKDLVKRGS